ncbi:MAG: regulatory protein TetR [Frankiales bacterium]|nr:regulatory protein TetR [Frankiales bacterium]
MARADRRDQLLDMAQDVFTERGYATTSMDDVAEAAGVTKPVLYDHFGSKEGLLAAVVERSGQEMLDATTGAVTGLDPETALRQGLTAFFRYVDEHAGAWTLLLREVAPGTSAAAAVDRVRAVQVDVIAALIGMHVKEPDPERATVYAHVVSGAAERLSTVRITGLRTSPEQAADLLMDALWTGFAALVEKEQA